MSCWPNRRCFPKAAPHKYASGVGESKSDDFTVKSCQISGHLSGGPLHPLMHNCKALPFAILMPDAFCGPATDCVDDVDKAVEGKKSKLDCDKGIWCSEHALHGYWRKYS